MSMISPEHTREDLIVMIHQLSALVSDLKETVAALRTQSLGTPSTLSGQIAAIYGELDAEDCARIDREWARMRGYISSGNGTSTLYQ